ncbi:MAG: cyclic nucleotide-binding domain-containing protein [Vicinamibacteria bacterium]|jgi:CRP-like cAMP-binding protein|nr:cyclic nucleotide-binding domain-containing protein [Vicinamibacteria bacterium]
MEQKVRTYVELLMRLEDKTVTKKAGETIFEAGQPGTEMYVVRSGTVELRVGEHALERVGEAGILGEMALVDQKPRSASAVAVSDCELVKVDEERFMQLVQHVPGFALEVMRVMAQRLRRTTQKTD